MDGSGRKGGDAIAFLIFSSVKSSNQSVAKAPEETSVNEHKEDTPRGLHVVANPIGPICNLNCEYCFYFEKQPLFAPGEKYRMSDKVLSAFIINYITSQPTPVVEFVWQGEKVYTAITN